MWSVVFKLAKRNETIQVTGHPFKTFYQEYTFGDTVGDTKKNKTWTLPTRNFDKTKTKCPALGFILQRKVLPVSGYVAWKAKRES